MSILTPIELAILRNSKTRLLLTLTAVLLAFLPAITSHTLSVDEEVVFNAQSNPWVWISDGRPGIAILKFLFMEYGCYPSQFSTLVAALLLFASATFLTMALTINDNLENKLSVHQCIGISLFCTFPITTSEFTSFSTYAIEIGIGILLATLGTIALLRSTSFPQVALSVFLLLFSFSIYQALLPLSVTIILFYYTFSLLQQGSTRSFRHYFPGLTKAVLGVAVSYFFYYVLLMTLHKFIPDRGYLATISSGNHSIQWSIDEFRKILFDNELGGTIITTVFSLAIFAQILSLLFAIGKNLQAPMRNSTFIINGFISMFLFAVATISAFSVPSLMGAHAPYRTLLSLLVFHLGCWSLTTLIIPTRWRITPYCLLCLIGLALSFRQAQVTNRIFLGDAQRFQNDSRICHEIVNATRNQLGQLPTKIVFVGGINPVHGPSIIRIESIGVSIFEWERGNNHRIIPFLNSLGYSFSLLTDSDLKRAIDVSLQAPNYPREGSVIRLEDLTVVKLNDHNSENISY